MSSPTRAHDWVSIAADLYDSPDALNIEDALVKAYARGLADGTDRERAAVELLLSAARGVLSAHENKIPGGNRLQAEHAALRLLKYASDRFPHHCAAAEKAGESE